MFFCGILKICVGRARPFLLDEGIAGFFFFTVKHSYLSFPSSHAALAMCFTRALQKRFSLPLIFYLYPIAIGASRVLLFAHFASDVVAGLLVGIVVERLLSIYYERFVESIKKLGSPKAS
ncbi:phosphatase PAP2 family protein [bacterium]|nr:phosphatase PAP2 family protein [bacterium]